MAWLFTRRRRERNIKKPFSIPRKGPIILKTSKPPWEARKFWSGFLVIKKRGNRLRTTARSKNNASAVMQVGSNPQSTPMPATKTANGASAAYVCFRLPSGVSREFTSSNIVSGYSESLLWNICRASMHNLENLPRKRHKKHDTSWRPHRIKDRNGGSQNESVQSSQPWPAPAATKQSKN